MNTIAIEPADITLKYNRGEITNASIITFNDSHIGYVGYCYTTNEWLAFTPTGDDIGDRGNVEANLRHALILMEIVAVLLTKPEVLSVASIRIGAAP